MTPILTRSGIFIYRWRWYVLAVWAVVIAVSAPFAPFATGRMTSGGFTSSEYESSRAREFIDAAFDQSSVGIILIVRHADWSPYSPEFIVGLQAMLEPVSRHWAVSGIETHLTEPELVSEDGRTVLANIELSVDIESSLDVLEGLDEIIDRGEFDVIITGGPTLYRDIVDASGSDLRRGEAVAFPLATITLGIVFGTVVAALIPVALGGVAVVTALAAIFWLATFRDLSILSFNIISLLGIGMGIDYSLYYVSRFRELRAMGLSVRGAVIRSQSQAGVAILFAGLSSGIGLSSLLLFDLPVLHSVGIGAMVVISLAVVAAMTLIPAILSTFGQHIERFRVVPRFGGGFRFWDRIAEFVMRRPVWVLLPTVALLIAMVLPVRDLQLGNVDPGILPRGYESREGAVVLESEFGWQPQTVLIVAHTVDGDPFAPETIGQMYALGAAFESVPGVSGVASYVNVRPTFAAEDYIELYRSPESIIDARITSVLEDGLRHGVVLFFVSSELHPSSSEARRLVGELRSFTPTGGGEILVSGGAADLTDQVNSLYTRFPFAIALVIVLVFVSLLVQFRSIVIPLKAVVLNMLGIFAAYGALVWVFQYGNLSWLLGFDPVGAIATTTPIVLFAVVFGLSMDYEIFLMSRIREAHGSGIGARASVREGLQKTGAVITGAGAIIIVVAMSFLVADIVIVKAVGLGLGVAILLDVTVVRLLVAPALMRLMGEWNWWLPKWLDRALPRL